MVGFTVIQVRLLSLSNILYLDGFLNGFLEKRSQFCQFNGVLCLGLFASIIAPFGGFFASGFKRAFKIEVQDFGDSIPGHGRITGRMDCQMVMAVSAYIYHQSFVVPQSLSVERILDQILMNLTFEEQHSLYGKLREILHEMLTGES